MDRPDTTHTHPVGWGRGWLGLMEIHTCSPSSALLPLPRREQAARFSHVLHVGCLGNEDMGTKKTSVQHSVSFLGYCLQCFLCKSLCVTTHLHRTLDPQCLLQTTPGDGLVPVGSSAQGARGQNANSHGIS